MLRLGTALAFVFALLVAGAAAAADVGFQHLTIPDPPGPPIEVGIWYPTDGTPKPTRVELFAEPLATDAPVKGRGLPLVVISHGTGGSYAGHIDTAIALARAGFVAASLTHTGDNWRDQSQAFAIWERSRQLKVLVDYMLDGWSGRAAIDPGRIGAFGFSAGGFTVLAAAGGEADLATVLQHCREHPNFYTCGVVRKSARTVPSKVAWVHDPRIRAVVSAAPALGFAFGKAGLANVRQPLQLWRAAEDEVLPHPYYPEAVRQALPQPPEMHVVENAGHYDFLAPCSPELAKANPEICASRPGFDRVGFHAEFDRDVVAFFVRTLSP